jgi:hypothetical protein
MSEQTNEQPSKRTSDWASKWTNWLSAWSQALLESHKLCSYSRSAQHFMEHKVHYCVHKRAPEVPVLSQFISLQSKNSLQHLVLKHNQRQNYNSVYSNYKRRGQKVLWWMIISITQIQFPLNFFSEWNFDLLLLSPNIDTINKNTETLIEASKEVGPEVNIEKTKYMSCDQNADQHRDIKIGNR